MDKPPPLRHKRAKGKWTCVIHWREGQTVKSKVGRVFMVPVKEGGEPQRIPLFPVGALCAMLGRSYRTIYKWETDYGFPRALFMLVDDGQKKRWYSERQLHAVYKLYTETFGSLQGKHRGKLKEFTQLVRAIWLIDSQHAEAS